MGLPEEALAASGVEKGGVVRKPLEPVKGAARDVLLEGDPDAKKKIMTAKDILTEGDVNIQSEEDLNPRGPGGYRQEIGDRGTGGARTPLNVTGETPANVLDISETVKAEDKKRSSTYGMLRRPGLRLSCVGQSISSLPRAARRRSSTNTGVTTR